MSEDLTGISQNPMRVCVCVWAAEVGNERARAHIGAACCVQLSGIGFGVDGKAGFHVAALNCCQSIRETGGKQRTRCNDKHE